MNKKAIFFDLDNTIYPVAAIGDELFEPVVSLIAVSEEFTGERAALEEMLRRKPFHYVAGHYKLSDTLKDQVVKALQELICNVVIHPFPGYAVVKSLPQRKFLVTAGFTKLQLSKLTQLGIEYDFDGIYIIDHSVSDETKKSKFTEIMAANNFAPVDILVVGDDPASEIRAAKELGIDAVLYDSLALYGDMEETPKINGLADLINFV